jgi:hypothetical protein
MKDDLIKSSLCCSCPKSGNFQKHILDPKNATEALFFYKIKILHEKKYLDGFVENQKIHVLIAWAISYGYYGCYFMIFS